MTLDQAIAIVKPHNDRILAEAKLAAAERKIAKLESALNSCLEYLDGKVDVVDGDYGVPEPNREMSLVSEINEALGKGGY